jgi:hypothetical protein
MSEAGQSLQILPVRHRSVHHPIADIGADIVGRRFAALAEIWNYSGSPASRHASANGRKTAGSSSA